LIYLSLIAAKNIPIPRNNPKVLYSILDKNIFLNAEGQQVYIEAGSKEEKQ